MKIKTIFAICVGMMFATANATTVLYQDFNQLVDQSQHVVTGTVKNIKTTKQKDGDIYTVVTLKNSSTVTSAGKNLLSRNVKIRLKGGVIKVKDKKGNVIGEEALITHGTPEFVKGEQVILFVSKNGVSDMPIVGWGQGVFKIDSSNTITDGNAQPVVGLSGADLVTLTKEGLMARGQYINKSTSNSEGTSDGVQLIESIGGTDRLVTHRQTTTSNSKDGLSLNRSGEQTALDASNFISMIQERIASTESKKSSLSTNQSVERMQTPNSLFVLPRITRNTAKTVDDSSNSKEKEGLDQTQNMKPTGAASELSEPASKADDQAQGNEQ